MQYSDIQCPQVTEKRQKTEKIYLKTMLFYEIDLFKVYTNLDPVLRHAVEQLPVADLL